MTRRAVASRVRHALAGVVRLEEALEDGDERYATAISEALELDLRELATELEEAA